MKIQNGITFVELIITIAILSISLVPLGVSLYNGMISSSRSYIEEKTQIILEGYMNEIIAMKFDELQSIKGEEIDACRISNDNQTRMMFNDIDDYHDLIESPPRLMFDHSIGLNYIGFKINIYIKCAGLELGFSDNHYAKRITITVIAPHGERRSLSMYKGNF